MTFQKKVIPAEAYVTIYSGSVCHFWKCHTVFDCVLHAYLGMTYLINVIPHYPRKSYWKSRYDFVLESHTEYSKPIWLIIWMPYRFHSSSPLHHLHAHIHRHYCSTRFFQVFVINLLVTIYSSLKSLLVTPNRDFKSKCCPFSPSFETHFSESTELTEFVWFLPSLTEFAAISCHLDRILSV